MGMVIERIYHFCSEQDAVALMPLLDTGAEVFGHKGNDNIEVRSEANTQNQETKREQAQNNHNPSSFSHQIPYFRVLNQQETMGSTP